METIHPNSRIADLIGLLTSLVDTFSGKTQLYKLEKEMEVDLDDFMPIVYTADSLGFVTIGEGDIVITDKGEEFLRSNIKKRKTLIRDSLKHAEPFKTALELNSFTVGELAEKLRERKVQSFVSARGNQDLDLVLIEWGIYSGLLRKEGETYSVQK